MAVGRQRVLAVGLQHAALYLRRHGVKFAVGLYLALLLNRHLPFKAISAPWCCSPSIVPTVLSAIAFWWLFDSQFSIISWSMRKLGLISSSIDLALRTEKTAPISEKA